MNKTYIFPSEQVYAPFRAVLERFPYWSILNYWYFFPLFDFKGGKPT